MLYCVSKKETQGNMDAEEIKKDFQKKSCRLRMWKELATCQVIVSAPRPLQKELREGRKEFAALLESPGNVSRFDVVVDELEEEVVGLAG